MSSLWLGGTGSRQKATGDTLWKLKWGPDSWRRLSANWGYLAPGRLVSVSAKNQRPCRLSGLGDILVAAGQARGSWVPVLVLSLPGAELWGTPEPTSAHALAMSLGAWRVRGSSREMRLSAVGRALVAAQATALLEHGPMSLGQSSSVRFLHSTDLV